MRRMLSTGEAHNTTDRAKMICVCPVRLSITSAPLARLTLEADRSTTDPLAPFAIVLQLWPTGEPHTLGHATPHGRSLIWE